MATKIFCDVPGCGRETTRGVVDVPIKVGDATPTLKVAPIAGDICKYCMIDAFKKLDDRPWPKAEIVMVRTPPRDATAEMIEEAARTVAPMPTSNVRGMVEVVWRQMYDVWRRSQP